MRIRVLDPGPDLLLVLTHSEKSVLQLQGEGRERNLFRYRQDGHSGQVGGLVPSIPLTAGGVEGQAASCRRVNISGTSGHVATFQREILSFLNMIRMETFIIIILNFPKIRMEIVYILHHWFQHFWLLILLSHISGVISLNLSVII